MKTVLIIFGTRPDAIKMAPLVLELQKSGKIETKICVTGQHREMLDQVLNLFQIVPDYDLAIMKRGQSLNSLFARLVLKLGRLVNHLSPDFTLIHGDTTTAAAAAVAAYNCAIPIVHVEAGLRSRNIYSPWPEEGNRCLITSISTQHFAPSKKAKQNLMEENVSETSITVTGNTVVDALHHVIRNRSQEKKWFNAEEKLLVTTHRRENVESGLENIFEALRKIAKKRPNIEIVYPMHLNPAIRSVAYKMLSDLSNIKLVEPMDYQDFIGIMNECDLILTDSGGVQEEAPSLNKPVIILRDTTERPELVSMGLGQVIGTNPKEIYTCACDTLDKIAAGQLCLPKENPFGDGNACKRIRAWFEEN